MAYRIEFSVVFEKQLRKLKRKDKILFERLRKKIDEIVRNPKHYKPLRNILKGTRRAHLDPFAIIFMIKGDEVVFLYVKHHDNAYAK